MSLETGQFGFGEFVLDANEKVLLREGKPLQVTPKVLQLLHVLIENHGHIVEKDDLMARMWPDSFVEESNLTFTVRQLRKILGDDAQNPRFIETVPRRGYRFIVSPEVRSHAANGANYSHNGGGGTVPEAGSFQKGGSRLVLFSVVAVILCTLLLTAGFFFWRGTDKAAGIDAFTPLKFERVMNSDSPITAAISRDGKYVAYSSTANGQQGLWLRQLSSGINTQIVAPEVGVTFGAIRFSANGDYIYFTRGLKDKGHLDRVSIFGGAVKTSILTGPDGAFSISPDDRLISFRRYEPGRRTLLIANIDGSDIRPLYETHKTFTDNVFSPDGKTIAFASGQSDTGDEDFGVYTIDIQNGGVKPATDFRWYHVRGIVWLPRQDGLLVTASAKSGEAMQLWKVSLPGGEVSTINNAQSGLSAISATADLSQILLTQVSRSSNLYLASPGAPDSVRPVAQASEGVVWSPGGDLVYGTASNGNNDIWLLKADGSTQKQLTTEDSVDYDPQVSPDGRYVVFVSNRAGKYNLWRINFDGTEPVQLTSGDGEQNPAFTPDGAFVVFNSMKDVSLWKVPVSGSTTEQITEKRCRKVSISPDGTKFAHFTRKGEARVAVVKTFPGNDVIHEFALPDGYSPVPGIVWANDGSSLIYGAEDSNSVGNLWHQPLTGGPPKQLTNYTSDEIFYFNFSPDGSQLAIVRGSWRHDVVLATLGRE